MTFEPWETNMTDPKNLRPFVEAGSIPERDKPRLFPSDADFKSISSV